MSSVLNGYKSHINVKQKQLPEFTFLKVKKSPDLHITMHLFTKATCSNTAARCQPAFKLLLRAFLNSLQIIWRLPVACFLPVSVGGLKTEENKSVLSTYHRCYKRGSFHPSPASDAAETAADCQTPQDLPFYFTFFFWNEEFFWGRFSSGTSRIVPEKGR